MPTPGTSRPALIEVMASDPRVCHYLDIPLQHGDPAVLRRMFRPSNTDKLIETFDQMRAAMPDMAFRSTFIVGYPGETERGFRGLLDFVEAIQFDKVGVFTFSPEPGTPAHDLSGQVAEESEGRTLRRLMAPAAHLIGAQSGAGGPDAGCAGRGARGDGGHDARRKERTGGQGEAAAAARFARPQLPGCAGG